MIRELSEHAGNVNDVADVERLKNLKQISHPSLLSLLSDFFFSRARVLMTTADDE